MQSNMLYFEAWKALDESNHNRDIFKRARAMICIFLFTEIGQHVKSKKEDHSLFKIKQCSHSPRKTIFKLR
jgi:hypothetical protein